LRKRAIIPQIASLSIIVFLYSLLVKANGSPDLYQSGSRLPINSVNFVTCHGGFTLIDFISYNYKHNETNGENNRDGINDNLSWNCGVEGETEDSKIGAFLEQQIKNFASILLLSVGGYNDFHGK
jgi:isoamylase